MVNIQGNPTSCMARITGGRSSVVSVAVAAWSLYQQRKHDRLSVRPVPEITGDHFEAYVVVRISNYGTGPLVIRNFVARSDSTAQAPSLYDCMRELISPICFTYWAINLPGRCIPAGESLTLVKIEGEYEDLDPESADFQAAINAVRDDLGTTELKLEYTDIYGSEFDNYSKSLSFFKDED